MSTLDLPQGKSEGDVFAFTGKNKLTSKRGCGFIGNVRSSDLISVLLSSDNIYRPAYPHGWATDYIRGYILISAMVSKITDCLAWFAPSRRSSRIGHTALYGAGDSIATFGR